jgi:glycosyltransferase involved in cell wall biosynthesis
MVQPDLKVIVDSVDVHFLRERAGAQLGLLGADQVEKTKQRELRVYRTADAVIAITPAECEALLGFAGMPPVFVVPNLLAVHKRKNCERKRELLFIGYFEHKPNVDGIIWFVNEVWPKVCMDIPEASLTIVGAAMPEEIRALGRLPGVESVGYVPDTLVYLDRAAVSIAPLRYGGGMKGKVTEAMAAGVPVVTTGVGAQGIPAISGTHLVIGDTVDEFAKGIVFLLRNRSEAERIGQAGQKLAAKLCGIDAGERAIEGMLDGIVAPVPAKLLFPVYGFCRLAWYVFARLFGLELLTVA